MAQTPSNGTENSLAAVLNPPKSRYMNWADDQEDDSSSSMPTPLISLPTGPRASRTFDDDSVPKVGPFLAYLSNLPYDLDEEQLEDFFSQLAVVSVRMPREDGGGRSRGYGYVEFETREDLIDAISLPDPTLNNRHIRIDVSTENDRRRQQGGRYGDREPLTAGESNWRRGGPGGGGGSDDRGGDRDGDRGGNSRYSSQTTSRDTNSDWRTSDRPAAFNDAPPMRRGDRDDRGGGRDGGFRGGDRDRDGGEGGGFRERYGGRRSNYEERSTRDASPPKERPKLQLQPRTLPIEPIVVAAGLEGDQEGDSRRSPSPPRAKPVPAANIFGAAKPVDTAAREREIEERAEKERQEEKRLREEARDKAREEAAAAAASNEEGEEATAAVDNKVDNEEEEVKPAAPKPAIMSWRRTTDEEENGGTPHQSSFRRADDRDRRGDDRRGGEDRDRRGDDRRGEERRGGGGYRDERRVGGDRDDRRGGEISRGGPPRGGDRGGDRDRRMDRPNE